MDVGGGISIPDSDFDRMGQILKRIFLLSKTLWQRGYTPEWKKVDETTLDDYNELLCIKPPIQEGKLEDLVRKPRHNRLLLDSPFYLPPVKDDKEFIPILQIKWKLGEIYDISVRIEMYRFVQTFPGGSRLHLRSLAFRFEMHGASKTHDFMHVQVTRTQHGFPDWLPTTIPCIPTKAHCPVSLLLCALASLYGKNTYNMLFSGMKMPKKYLEPLKQILMV